MSEAYESYEEILRALGQRGCETNREHLAKAMNNLNIRGLLSDQDIDDLRNYLGSEESIGNRHEIKANKVLSQSIWRDAVSIARSKIQIPAKGITEEQARKLHLKWLHTWLDLASCKSHGVPPSGETTNEFCFWQLLIRQTTGLCYLVRVDPAPLVSLRVEDRKHNRIDQLLGLGRLLHPDFKLKIDGQPIDINATPTDRLMGHVLWDLPLTAKDLECGPRVTVNWHCPTKTEGSYQETRFLSAELNATELREQQQFLTWIQHNLKHTKLVDFPRNGTWEECWREWNRRFPDWAFPTAEAMRKNVDYWEKSLRPKSIR